MAITNLTGYKWQPNASVSITSAKTYNIVGNCVGESKSFETTTFELRRQTQTNPYSGAQEYFVGLYLEGGVFDNFIAGIHYWCSSSSSSSYPSTAETADKVAIITFTGGTDLTNTELIAWLEANGTLTKPAITQLAPFLTNIANAIRKKKGTTTPINAQDFASEIESIEGGSGGGATLKGGWTGTQVPVDDTTFIENIYLNTQLSNEEVSHLIIENISLFPTDGMGAFFANNNIVLAVMYSDGIIGIIDTQNANFYFAYDNSGAGQDVEILGFSGWNPTFNGTIEINSINMVSSVGYDSEAGNENLKSLISITPFEKISPTILSGEYTPKNIEEKIEITENGTTTLTYASDFATKEILNKVDIKINTNVVMPGIVELIKKKPNMQYFFAFYQGADLNEFNLPYDCTSEVYDMSYMFAQSARLKTIPSLDTSNAKQMNRMFYLCGELTETPTLNTNLVENMSYMFERCYKINTIDITKLADNSEYFAAYCHSLTKLIIRTLDTIPTYSATLFTQCYHFYGTTNTTYNPDGLRDGRIYIPDDKVEELKATEGWSNFANIIVPLSTLPTS